MFAIPREESSLLAVIAICWVTLAFIIYNLLQGYIRTTIIKHRKNASLHPDNMLSVLLQRSSGVFLFGLIPIILLVFVFRNNPSLYGFQMKNSLVTLIVLLITAVVVISISWITSRSRENLATYPQIREKEWNISLLVLSAFSWIAYLLAYEFMYRGFLLFACYHAFGTWPAIIINTSLYSLTHLVKNRREGIGAFFIGIILCILVLYIGSLWVAFYVHVIMALSNEWFSLRNHPDINFNFKRLSKQ
jgi:membrane protease YdiL (CAAX protease family)